MTELRITPTVCLPDDELRWTAVRSGGPGGQNVNKVATKVELRFHPASSRALTELERSRLLAALGGRLSRDGWLVVCCDTTRSQVQNLELARERMAEWLRAGLRRPTRRVATRPTRASKERRLGDKAHASRRKADRQSRGD
ncbi:MAG TPA: alternative ribosome rescue aminoacyl-tRNA hydrolase ArfB [Polyangiaceae bacterium]|nr:alternative ribosome rescue aminoacyl-tRNA hydrolase ArfB [Polyangiaceae bacterium]